MRATSATLCIQTVFLVKIKGFAGLQARVRLVRFDLMCVFMDRKNTRVAGIIDAIFLAPFSILPVGLEHSDQPGIVDMQQHACVSQNRVVTAIIGRRVFSAAI